MHNSNYYILTHMVGSVNTADEAYRVLHYDLEHIKHGYDYNIAGKKTVEANLREFDLRVQSGDYIDKLKAEAERGQLEADIQRTAGAIERTERQMAFMRELMTALEPMRKYGHLPLLDAFEACQAEEWALELLKRARNFLLTQHTIPTDHFEAMTQHPWFEQYIAPHIAYYLNANAAGTLSQVITNSRPQFIQALQAQYPTLIASASIPALDLPPLPVALIADPGNAPALKE